MNFFTVMSNSTACQQSALRNPDALVAARLALGRCGFRHVSGIARGSRVAWPRKLDAYMSVRRATSGSINGLAELRSIDLLQKKVNFQAICTSRKTASEASNDIRKYILEPSNASLCQ